MSDQLAIRKLPKAVWLLPCLLSVAFPFICLRVARAISTTQCILGVLAALLVQGGLVSVLINTNGQPLQNFIELLLMISIYLLVLWQYLAGHNTALWSTQAEREWRLAGRFFGGLIAVSLAANILAFQLQQHLLPRPHQARPPKIGAPAAAD